MRFNIFFRSKVAILPIWLLLSVCFVSHSKSAEKSKTRCAAVWQYYDEIRTASGAIRPHYKSVWPVYTGLSATRKKQFLLATKAEDFKGDNALNPLPRIFTQKEYQTIREGVTQRALALRMFLKDHFSGLRSYAKAGVIPSTVINHILARNHETSSNSYLRKSKSGFSFTYGPDGIRTKSGEFAWIEDNPGYVGGFGDLIVAHDALIKRIPEYRDVLPEHMSPERFYKNLIESYRSRANGGEVVNLTFNKGMIYDNEPIRQADIYARYGVTTVYLNPYQKHGNKTYKQYLESTKSGVFLVTRNPNGSTNRKKVGYVILDMDAWVADPSHPISRDKRVVEQARKYLEEHYLKTATRKKIEVLVKPNPKTGEIDIDALEAYLTDKENTELSTPFPQGVEGLFDSYLGGKVQLSTTPGIDFIGDKGFYPYVDKLIEFYLNEKPIIRNIPTWTLAKLDKNGGFSLNQKTFSELERNFSDRVTKPNMERGGDGIAIGPKVRTKKEKDKYLEKVKERPDNFITQEFSHLSVMDGLIVDHRIPSQVFPDNIYVTEAIWSRALPINGSGKVNLSGKGSLMPVFIQSEEN